MARRRRNRVGGSDGQPHLWIVGGGLLLLALTLAGGYGYLLYEQRQIPTLDKDTFCPTKGPIAVQAVLFDTSDPITTNTRVDLTNQFEQIISTVPKGGLVAIYAISAVTENDAPLFYLCNPGNGAELSELTGNPRIAKERWEKVFREPLDKIIVNVDPQVSTNSSPIMSAIQAIKLRAFDGQNAGASSKRFLIVSDMLEHTDAYSQYKSGLSFDAYLNSGAVQLRDGALDGIDFEILYVRRKTLRFSSIDHVAFWNRWIGRYGGRLVRTVQLEGDN